MRPPDTTIRPLRADAERNRRRILDTAAIVFAERGLDVSLDEIATAAGVGVGTVYRRFPDKHTLVDAVFEDKIAQVTDLATSALDFEDPWEGFVHFFTGVCEFSARDRGFKDALLTHDAQRERVAKARRKIEPVASKVLRRAQESGHVRADINQFDVPLLHMVIGATADTTRAVDPDYWRRSLQIVLDGLAVRRDEPTPMTARPMNRDGFDTSMASRARMRR